MTEVRIINLQEPDITDEPDLMGYWPVLVMHSRRCEECEAIPCECKDN